MLKKAAKNPILKELGKIVAKEVRKLYSKGASKIKNKRLKKLAGSNFANMLADSGVSYIHDKLE